MLVKKIHNTLLTAILITSSVSISGCTNSPSLPIAKVQKDFKNEFDIKTLSNTIADAAKEKDWNIVNQTPTSMSLKKTYQKIRILTTTHERWKRVTIDHDIYVNVDMNQKSFKINLSDQSEQFLRTDSDRELFNEDLGNLEKAIYGKLTEVVL